MAAAGSDVLATRVDEVTAKTVLAAVPAAIYHPQARAITLKQTPHEPKGHIAILTAGTSDQLVAEEAAITAELFNTNVIRLYDIGVAGIHRLLSVRDQLTQANVVIVCAGMEGALPSVVGGLVGVPVIAVPTSVGYGASFDGAAALLGMLNSCSPNVTVVNIDNGFGAAYTAVLIARAAASTHPL
jgi:NCAIR mutase (PurE)-related protein